MSLRVIDKKKVEVTDDEWLLYTQLVSEYTKEPYQKGEDFFIDLFETNDEGIIIFLKPPSQRRVSLEIFLFLMSLMTHQHLRLMRKQIDDVCDEMKHKLHDLEAKISQLNK